MLFDVYISNGSIFDAYDDPYKSMLIFEYLTEEEVNMMVSICERNDLKMFIEPQFGTGSVDGDE